VLPLKEKKEYSVNYKDIILKHKFHADFVFFDKIILEIKTCDSFVDSHIALCLNHLKISNNELALLVNFNKKSVDYKLKIIK
jgi:GxxExxY protein